MKSTDQQDLITFPCHFEFKAFGPNDDDDKFFSSVQNAVSSVVPVARQAMKTRPSSGGKYQCVSVVVPILNRQQLEAIYAAIRTIDDLKYLL